MILEAAPESEVSSSDDQHTVPLEIMNFRFRRDWLTRFSSSSETCNYFFLRETAKYCWLKKTLLIASYLKRVFPDTEVMEMILVSSAGVMVLIWSITFWVLRWLTVLMRLMS